MNHPPVAQQDFSAGDPTPSSPLRRGIARYPVEFTGSGREYFRVWIVNVLLSVVTLGLYTPWARRRKAQYFFTHTRVVDAPLEFAGRLRQMVFGFLVFAALYGCYELSINTGQDLVTKGLLIGAAVLWPLLWTSAMRFRLRATRWRGLALNFHAPLRQVYAACWPALLAAGLLAAAYELSLVLSRWHMNDLPPIGQCRRPGVAELDFPLWIGPTQAVLAVALLLVLPCVARLDYNFKRLLVLRTRIGDAAGRFKPTYRDFLHVWARTALIFGAGVLVLYGLYEMTERGFADPFGWLIEMVEGSTASMVLAILLYGLILALLFVFLTGPARAYREARLFQLVWNNVGLGHMTRTRCDLRTGAYVGLRVKNMLLTYVTLGFYRPFAVASEYAAKAGSVTFYVKGRIDQLEGELVRQQGAFGDAAADALGLDFIG